MRKGLVLVLVLVFLAASYILVIQPAKAESVAPQVQWSQTYSTGTSSAIRGMTHTSDGGYALSGLFMDVTFGEGGAWLVKTDSSGNEEWQQTYPGLGDGYSVIQTSDGGYAITGSGCLIKTDSSGNMQWSQKYAAQTISLVQTSDGGYALAGGSGSSFVLIKTNAAGQQLWNQTYSGQGLAWSVIQTSDGGYALAGGSSHGCLVKTDSLGNLQWNQTLGATLYSVIQAKDGGFVVAGNIKTPSGGNNDMWLAKVDSSGTMLWNQTYNIIDSNSTSWWGAWSVIQTSDGGYAVGGSSGLVKTDSSGNLKWSLSLNGTAYFVVQTSDGGYAFAGGQAGIFFAGAWLAGTDPYSAPTLTPSPSPLPTPSQQPTLSPVLTSTSPTVSEFSLTAIVLVMVVLSAVFFGVVAVDKSKNRHRTLSDSKQ